MVLALAALYVVVYRRWPGYIAKNWGLIVYTALAVSHMDALHGSLDYTCGDDGSKQGYILGSPLRFFALPLWLGGLCTHAFIILVQHTCLPDRTFALPVGSNGFGVFPTRQMIRYRIV